MSKLVSKAVLGLVASAGVVLMPTVAHADHANVGAGVSACVAAYETGDLLNTRALNRCIARAVAAAGVASVTYNSGILGSATDGGVNTGILGRACGDGSVNTGILGSAGC